jgi:hypothetical protein
VLAAILRAVFAAVRRDLGGLAPLRTNNFFLFIALLIWGAAQSGVEPASSYPFLALLALLLFFPLSSDPLAKIPSVRFALWPSPAKSQLILRLVSLALSPLVWFAVFMLIREGGHVLPPLSAVLAAAVVRARAPHSLQPLLLGRAVPAPPVALGILCATQLRRMITVLDTWLAALIAIVGVVWKIGSQVPDPTAGPILAILVGIALSTQAQSGAGLDTTRYRLLPVPALRIIAVRDMAYLSLVVLLSAGLDLIAGLTFAMAALALGRYPSIRSRLDAERWRFAGGRVGFGALQMIAGAALASAGWLGAAIAAVAWVVSLFWGASVLAQRLRGIDAPGAPGR